MSRLAGPGRSNAPARPSSPRPATSSPQAGSRRSKTPPPRPASPAPPPIATSRTSGPCCWPPTPRSARPRCCPPPRPAPPPPGDPAARLDAVIDAFTRLVADTEPQQRTMLRLSLEPDPDSESLPLRKGRAIGWIDEALAPLRGQLTPGELRRLVLAIRSATGIEARVWLTDIAGLTGPQATQLQRWTARAIYR